ncbi:MAG TPA: hypothetical protein VIL94_11555 [Acidothermaceae bacterium]|jgi:hypothetical protein
MNRLSHHRRFALVAAGIAGTGVLVTGVASAATSNPASDGLSGISTASLNDDGTSPAVADSARGKLAQALKQIRTELKAGTVSGEVTVDTKKGPQTIEFQRGAVSQSASGSFTVTDSSGGVQTWTVGPKMKVRDRAQRKAAGSAGTSATSATVTDGENVVVVGLKTDTTETARLVVVVPTKAPHAPKGSSPSGVPSTTTNPATSALQS